MNSVGKMQSTSGNIIFTGACWACCSARWRRFMRICSACTRRTVGDARTHAFGLDDGVDEGREVRHASALRHLFQGVAAQLAQGDFSQRHVQLFAEGTLHLLGHAASAASRPRPASTQVVIRSKASGRLLRISLLAALDAVARARTSAGRGPKPANADDDQRHDRAGAGCPTTIIVQAEAGP